MMKRMLLLMAVMLTTAALSVQAQTRTVSGSVVDNEQREAVVQATVALLRRDSSLVANAKTNLEGRFTMTAPDNGQYLVRITYVGYKPLFKTVTMSGSPVNLGTLTLEVDAVMLKGTEVVKNLAKVYSKEDTLIYNAGAYKTPEGSVVEELVKKLPGAEVSDDGSITINGKQVKKIKVDGKEFMTGDTQTAIKNLPTSIVERVKAYDEKSDQARVTGIDDGEEEMVLDFGLKRGMNRGTFANVDGGLGTKHRYSGRMMGAKFNSQARLMAFAQANNVNDMGFGGGGGGGRFGGGGRNGLQASKMVGLNANYEQKDRLKLSGSVRWNHGDGDAWSRRATESFVSRNGAFSNSVSQNYSRSNSWNGQARLEWSPDTLWNINFRPTFSWSTNDGTSRSTSASFTQDPYNYVNYALDSRQNLLGAVNYLRQTFAADSLLVNSRDNASLSYSDNNRLGADLTITRKFGNQGRNISLRLSGNYTDGNSRSLSLQDVNLYQTTMAMYDSTYSEYFRNRYNLTPTKNYDYSARLSYSEPIARQTYLQFSYNFQYRYTKSDRTTYDFSEWPTRHVAQGEHFSVDDFTMDYRQWDPNLALLQQYAPLDYYLDDSLSRFSEYKNFIHTAEVMLRVVRKAFNFNVGLQVIPQTSKFTYRYLGVDYGTTTRTVMNWSPTANFRWKKSNRSQLRFTYRGSTSQPSMSDLLEIRDDSDPLNVTVGNKGLKPSFTQDFNLRYNDYFERHQQFLFANLRFSTTSNATTSKVYYDPLTGGRTSTRDNINGNWNTRGEFMFNTALDTLGTFNLNTRTSASYTHSVSYLDVNRDGNILKNAVNETNLNQRLGASYRNDNFEFELNGNVGYTFGRNKLQAQGNQDTWNFSYGFNTTYQFDFGLQLTTNLNMQSRRGYTDASMNTNELIWNAQVAQSFLRGKPLSVRLEFYDLLHQQSSFSRTLSAMQRSDTEYNAINSYVMLRVNYRLNLFGTREARQGMGPGGFGGPGGDGPGGDGPGGNRGGNRGGTRGGGRGGFGGGGFGGPGRF